MPDPFGKHIDPNKLDARGHINQHIYPATGDPANKENNSFLHDDLQGLLSLISSALGVTIGPGRIPVGPVVKEYCATGTDPGIPEDTNLVQIMTVYSNGDITQKWLRPPSVIPLGIIPQVKAQKCGKCCSDGGAEEPDPDPVAVIGGFERGRETLYTTQIQGIEFGELVGIISPQTGNKVLPDGPFLTLPPFIRALQNWITDTPGVYGIVSATVDNIGNYTITVAESNIEITAMYKANSVEYDWTTIQTRSAYNAVISPTGTIGDYVRAAIDTDNNGSRDWESSWTALTDGLLLNADIPILDGDKVILEASSDGITVDSTATIIIPDTDLLAYQAGTNSDDFYVDIDSTFDPAFGKELTIYVLDAIGRKLNGNDPIYVSPAQDSYANEIIEIASLALSAEAFGLEIVSGSVGFSEWYPFRLFYQIHEEDQTGSYDSSYDSSYD